MGEAATLEFHDGRVLVRNGLHGNRDLTIRADSATILDLSNLRIGPLGMPIYYDDVGRSVVAKLVRRRLVIDGFARHPRALNALTRIFSVR